MISYYNEFDPKAAAWLRQLIKNGNITNGEVDERSITEVKADDIMGFRRAHFFAGIGTWDYCLNEAGWGDRQVWTASLPCQPFSVAGKGLGKEDERHLLPHFMELVRQCKPDTIFGEQVAAAIKHGWIDDLHANMEAEGYAIGHFVFGAHSVGSAHIRQRLYWVANSINAMHQREVGRSNGAAQSTEDGNRENVTESGQFGGAGEHVLWMVNTEREQYEGCLSGYREEFSENRKRSSSEFAGSGAVGGMGNTSCRTSERDAGEVLGKKDELNSEWFKNGIVRERHSDASEIDWLYCRDNKYRPIKSGLKPLVDGSAKRVVFGSNSSEPINADYSAEARAMRLKGYGNAIVAQCGIEFIQSFMDITFSHDDLNKK